MNPMDIIVKWFSDLFQSSGSRALEDSMKQIQAAPLPDFGAEWYQTIWMVNFAVAILLSITSVTISIAVATHQRKYKGIADALRGLALTFVFGYLLLLGLYGFMYTVDVFCDLIIRMTTGSDSDEWYVSLVTLKNATNPAEAIFFEAFSWAAGKALLFQTWFIQQGVYVFALLIVLAVSFYENGIGEKFVRWLKAAIISSILAKLLIISLLAIWSMVILKQGLTGVAASANLAGAMVISALIPIGLFFSIAVKRKQKVEVEGNVQTTGEGNAKGSERISSVPSKPKFGIPDDLTDRARVTNTRATKIRIASDGISTVALMAAPKAVSIHPVVGAVVGGIGVTAKVVSSGAGKVERSSAKVIRVTPYIDDTVTFSRNVRSNAADKKAQRSSGNGNGNDDTTYQAT